MTFFGTGSASWGLWSFLSWSTGILNHAYTSALSCRRAWLYGPPILLLLRNQHPSAFMGAFLPLASSHRRIHYTYTQRPRFSNCQSINQSISILFSTSNELHGPGVAAARGNDRSSGPRSRTLDLGVAIYAGGSCGCLRLFSSPWTFPIITVIRITGMQPRHKPEETCIKLRSFTS